jgi:hypothetical protein
MRTCPLVAGRQRPVPPDTEAASATLVRSIAVSVIDNKLQQRSVCQHKSGYVRIRQDTSGYVRIRQDTSGYTSVRGGE